MPHVTPALLAAALLAAACVITGTAQAAPFAVTYSGGITTDSTHTEIPNGLPFSVTFIVDNGGTTGAGQRWLLSDLTCTIWHIGSNSGGSQRTTFTHPLTGTAGQLAYGSGLVQSNATGTALVEMIDAGAYAVPDSDYTVAGPIALGSPVTWNVNGFRRAMLDAQGSFDNAAGPGVPVDPQQWGRPVAVTGPCDDTPANAPPPPPPPGPHSATPVPTLGLPALALLGMGAAGLGALRLRRRS